ncbi:hypothetical protein R1sor_001841 [Riccia sorocarpa]|uniref:Germin-like protein n=1 Tax=Riccia sorocarpa TaxID=122646 RepID=A0ABD3GZS0_9MARC
MLAGGVERKALTSPQDSGSFSIDDLRGGVPNVAGLILNVMASLKLAVSLVLTFVLAVHGRDPDVTTDFVVPPGVNASTITGEFFTFRELRDFSAPAGTFASKKVTHVEFPALTGLGVGVTLLEYRPKTVNPPHTHPRGTELLFVLSGSLDVGVVDSANKLYSATISKGDLFVFPQGLVHFQINKSAKKPARAISAFGSSNAGTISLPRNVFGSGIDDAVLLSAFQITADELKALKAPFQPTM